MNKKRVLTLVSSVAGLASMPSCTNTTVRNPDGSITTTKSLDPAVSQALANGAVIITGAAAQRLANELAADSGK